MLKDEYVDVMKKNPQNIFDVLNEEECSILRGFLFHIDYVTAEPSAIDKQVVAKAYHSSK